MEIEVIVDDIKNLPNKSPETTQSDVPVNTQSDVPKTRNRANTQDMAKQAIQLVLGTDNDYLQRLLTNKLEGREKKYKRIPLTKIVHRGDRSQLRETLSNATTVAQKNAVDVLVGNELVDIEDQTEPQSSNDTKNQAVTSWVLNTVLQEKLKDREARESSDYWKYINGGLAIILPIITGLADHFLTSYFGKCNAGSS